MSETAGPVLVIGVGNDLRGDDAAGLEVARGLRALAPGFDVALHHGEGSGLLERWYGSGAVVLVDAVRSGAPPGTVHRLEASAAPLPEALHRGSSHAVGVSDAIELARVLGRLPETVVVYGVEGDRFEAGAALSDAVAAAVQRLVGAVGREAQKLSAGTAAGPTGARSGDSPMRD